ncbi:MAG: hypothetical protein IPM29_05465 [Planctomycetes bacterium]|nr:hypothetical protein [Planctomycetota bacterium]
MKWLLAGLAFAAVVGLAVATAAVRAHNIAERAALQRLAERLEGARIEAAGERARLARACELRELIQRWRECRQRIEGRGS